MTSKLLVGPHLSISAGFAAAIAMAQSINATAMQIFSKSNRSWFAKKIDLAEAAAFRAAWQSSNVKYVAVHACYLINLASSNSDVVKNSIKSLVQEMQRCADLGIQDLILHPGAHTGLGREAGVAQVAAELQKILASDQTGTRILLENMAGQGTTLGADFAELAAIRSAVPNNKQLGFCLDTCHAFAAGYDFVAPTAFAHVAQQIEKHLGWQHLHAIQLNDSKMPLGSHKDRHANLGEGLIGVAGLQNILQHPFLNKLPLLLETPDEKGLPGYEQEILMVHQLHL